MTAFVDAAVWAIAVPVETVQPMACRDDATLVREFLDSGKDEPFEVLVARYRDRVFRLVVAVLGPGGHAQAEDLVQEVFLQVYRKLDSFRADSSFSTWLYRITRNRAIDHLRRTRRDPSSQSEEVLADVPITGESADPSAATQASQEGSNLRRCVAQLPEPQRTVVHLYYWLERSVGEIAQVLDLPSGTVKSHLYRARERIARELAQEATDD